MDYRYLKAFSSAARHLSFRKAADDLRISPSAVTRQIALLEQSAGGELFIRGNRQIALTELGTRLFESLGHFEGCLRSLANEPPLRVGSLQSVFEFFVVGAMKKNTKAFRGPLDIEIAGPKTLHERLVSGKLDLILTNHPPTAEPTLSCLRLFQETIERAGSSGRPIVYTAFEDRYSRESLHHPDRIRIDSFNGALALVNQGFGQALFARPVRNDAEKPRCGQWIYAVLPAYRRPPGRIKVILETLKKHAMKTA